MTQEKSIDLFTPVLDRSEWHPNFARILGDAFAADREVLQAWAMGFVDRDRKFVKEFQRTFNSSFWELYLHALWRELGLSIDMTQPRPDFVLDGHLSCFVAEAVIAAHPLDGQPEWTSSLADLADAPGNRANLLDLASLRLAHAIMGKHKKWVEGYSRLAHCSGKPYVVCVAPFDQPLSWLQGTEAIDRVLFGGVRELFIGDGDGSLHTVGVSRTDAVFKPTGTSVRLGLFCDDRIENVSAVLFSSLATWSKVQALARDDGRRFVFLGSRLYLERGALEEFRQPKAQYRETLIDGAHIFVNPFARYQVDPAVWRQAGFGVHVFQDGRTRSDVPDGCLVMRNAFQIRSASPGGATSATLLREPSGKQPYTRSNPPDGVLFSGPAVVGTSDRAQLMLHRGWTLLVARDIVDGDWSCLAKQGVYLSVDEFVRARVSGEGEYLSPFFPQRDESISDARNFIDQPKGVEEREEREEREDDEMQ